MFRTFLEKGIHLSFYDASYIDTKLHHLNTHPSSDQKRMIIKIIKNYYRIQNDRPIMSDPERAEYSIMRGTKKNVLIERARKDTFMVLSQMRFEATIRKVLIGEGVTSESTYKRRFKGGTTSTFSAALPAKSAQSVTFKDN